MERDHPFPAHGYIPGFRPRRPVTDYGSTMVQWMRHRRPRYKGSAVVEQERPSMSYVVDMVPPLARPEKAAESLASKHLHSCLNKIKHPINVVRWTPEGRRLLTGSTSGEFTLWNGMGFNFETIMQAHDSAVRAAQFSHSGDWLVSAEHDGIVKYWQTNFNNVKAIQAHNEPIRDLAFAPTDSKFVTASDDATLKIYDFAGGLEESTLAGHGWEAKTVDWHPTKGLLVSGSRDHQVKLWDPRTGRCLTTLHGHKNIISKCAFEPTQGLMLATCARDHIARIFDLRMMRDVLLLRGHEKDLTTLAWHPIHRNYLATGGMDGSIFHFMLDEQNAPEGTASSLSPYESPDTANAPAQSIYPAHKIPYAHDFAVWSLDWHPLGHLLTSGSNDRITRFWTRARPGDASFVNDRYHIGQAAAEAQGNFDRRDARRQMREEEEQEAQDEAEGLEEQQMPLRQPVMPGLPGISTDALMLPGIGGGAPMPPPIPSNGAAPFPPPPPPGGAFPGLPPGIDPSRIDISKLAELFGGSLPPPPPNAAGGQVPPPFPPPPADLANFPGGIPPPHLLPPGFPPPPPGAGGPVPPPPQQQQQQQNGPAGGTRKRAPLPSQRDSLKEEMRRGNYRTAR